MMRKLTLFLLFFLGLFSLLRSASEVSAQTNKTWCVWNDNEQKCTQVVECNPGCAAPNLNCPGRLDRDTCLGSLPYDCNCNVGTLYCEYVEGKEATLCRRMGSCGANFRPSPEQDPCLQYNFSKTDCENANAGTCVPVSIPSPTAAIPYSFCQGDSECENCAKGGGSWTALGCLPTSTPEVFINWLLRAAIGVAGGIAIMLMIFGGIFMILSTGDPKRLQTGKDIFTSAIIGLIMIIFSIFILRIIGYEILGIFR